MDRLKAITSFHMVLLMMVALFCVDLSAEGLESKAPKLVAERPNPSGPPTEVTIGIYLLDIADIDDVNQLFSVDLFVDVTWQDPRLVVPEELRTGKNRRIPLEEIWTPRLMIVNDRGLNTHLPRVAEVDDLGNVNTQQRVSGELYTDLLFTDFPFDTQVLPIRIVTYSYSAHDLRFSLDNQISGDDGSFSAEGWRFRIIGPEINELFIPAKETAWARLTYLIEAERNSRYYVLTMILPVSLIVLMSWLVFWLPPDVIPSRVSISTASIFSLIAFSLSIRLGLPRVSYVTHADLFLIGCTLLVILALGIVVIGSRWAKTDRMNDALRLNAVARWVYAGLFFLTAIITLMI
jgi:gamma-aminobutyric acid receptor subunit beta